MLGLNEEAMLRMLKKDIPEGQFDSYWASIHEHLIPNIVEVILANNEAILFDLEKERTKDD